MIKVLIVTELKEKNAEFVSGREFSNGETLVVITLYEDCLWAEDVLWLWPKVIEQVQGKVHNCTRSISFLLRNIGSS